MLYFYYWFSDLIKASDSLNWIWNFELFHYVSHFIDSQSWLLYVLLPLLLYFKHDIKKYEIEKKNWKIEKFLLAFVVAWIFQSNLFLFWNNKLIKNILQVGWIIIGFYLQRREKERQRKKIVFLSGLWINFINF